jgi:hypothetical protein
MRLLSHFWHSRPLIGEAISAMLIWGTTMPICMIADYFIWRHMLAPNATRLVVIFALGAAFAAPITLWFVRIIGTKNSNSAFATSFILLSVFTIAFTAILFALDFWHYFVQWHGPTFSKLWLNQFIFTFASALYQFLVSGLRLYLPCGLIALIIASLWASQRITR